MDTAAEEGLLGRFPAEITALLISEPAFRGNQIFQWLHQRSAISWSAMSNLPKLLRERLSSDIPLYTSTLDLVDRSSDGTVKIRIRLSDGNAVEAVLLTDANGRLTACLSTQVGCAMGCRFCKTATMGLIRNLTATEIIEQFYLLEQLDECSKSIDSIVFMGMGEPFMNFPALSRTISILNHTGGRAMSPRRFTVSTSGIIDGIQRLGIEHPQVRLALSLVSADPGIRGALMPVEQRNPLPALRKALLNYQKAGGRRITLEYVLLKGINDRHEDLNLVKEFSAGLSCNINLIPWNPAEKLSPVTLPSNITAGLAEPDEKTVQEFGRELETRGLTVVIRHRKGRGVNAACGQLATENKQN